MKLLILSFYYSPDLCAGSFRCAALVKQLQAMLGEKDDIEVLTTMPHRYSSFSSEALAFEQSPGLTIHRIPLRAHHGSLINQIRGFWCFARAVHQHTKTRDYDVVFATSGRLMTAVLGAWVARHRKTKLYLDVRDIFVETINDVLVTKFARMVKPFFSCLEKWALKRADRINLVSQGFESYFRPRYPHQSFCFFTNGVDTDFIDKEMLLTSVNPKAARPVTVLYAGNIGEGQGLHHILPPLAKRFEGSMQFKVIGDGGQKKKLLEAMATHACTNIELLPPVRRDVLVKAYEDADILFLHLNDYPAFRRVLPSKLFEYAATGKPIWAGVAGYAATFIRDELNNAVIFDPCDVTQAEQVFALLDHARVSRSQFVEKYGRHRIMQRMATDVINVSSGVVS